MKRMLEVQGKKENDAIAEGLKKLGLTLDDVDVKIISAGGFLKKAKVEIYYDAPDEKEAFTPTTAHSAPSAPVNAPFKAKDVQAGQNKGNAMPVSERSPADDAGKPYFAKKENKPPFAKTENDAFKNDHRGVQISEKTGEKQPERPFVVTQKNNAATLPAEPHWGAPANFNPEPTVKPNFGKIESKVEGEAAPEQNKVAEKTANENHVHANNRPNNLPNRNSDFKGANTNRPSSNSAPISSAVRQENRPFAERGDANPVKDKRERETMNPTPVQSEEAVAYLKELLEKMGIIAQVEIKLDDGLRMNVVTQDSRIIGFRGEVLDSIQYLISLKVNKSDDMFVHVSLDALDYRNKRKDMLEKLAARLAEKAVSTGKKITMAPMNSADRRYVHAVLSEMSNITTRSEGREPMRHIVILAKKD